MLERQDQEIVDVSREVETKKKHEDEGEQRFDEARAQLDQMIHERRLSRLDIRVGHERPASSAGWAGAPRGRS